MGCVVTYQPLLPDLNKAKGPIAGSRRVAGARAGRFYLSYGKRAVDLVLVAVTALPVGILVAVLALMIAAGGASPIFGHERVGKGGRVFRCWKLRTMVPDAEARLIRHLETNPEAAREWAETQKLSHDPRVTRIGHLLRRSSLDELPQLWNVLRGDMSIVGPRPVTETELDRYGTARAAYLAMRPGITGLWQVRGRNSLSFMKRIAMDVEYA
ncbi:MAG: hypothetical protein RL216_1468 [Pseudomonadota bacterium]